MWPTGATNASLSRTESPEEITLERALELLADRAAKGGGKEKGSAESSGEKARDQNAGKENRQAKGSEEAGPEKKVKRIGPTTRTSPIH